MSDEEREVLITLMIAIANDPAVSPRTVHAARRAVAILERHRGGKK